MTELINTAIEKANDALKKSNDPLIKFSKDAASASVFIALCLVGVSLLNLLFSLSCRVKKSPWKILKF